MANGNNRTTITVAVISLISALAVAVISNYDKLFNREGTAAPTPTVTKTARRSVANNASPTKSDAPKTSYKRMDFGYNGCNVQFGEVKTGVSEADMVRLATAANAKGFTYHASLNYGRIMIGEYPKGCRASERLSWPLYLKE